MVELDFRERDQQARARFAERLARLKATLAKRDVQGRPVSRPQQQRPNVPAEEPTWWWQRD